MKTLYVYRLIRIVQEMDKKGAARLPRIYAPIVTLDS